ncbi:hypothetical protein RCC89_03705 [Cytophagaceae bacterium ABcell3]|nr:hypothetical protein RCC89_03705 [Cytophagaceae bacterium ABcell3]
MKKLTFSAMAIAMLFSLFSCEDGQDIDKSSVKQAVNERKIVRLTDAEFQDLANTLGRSIADTLFKFQTSEDSLTFITDLTSSGGIKLKTITPFDHADQTLSEVETQVMDAYEYNIENNLELSANLQKNKDVGYLYSAPVSNDSTAKVLFIEMDKPSIIKKGYLKH